MSNEFCMKLNNATQRLFGNIVRSAVVAQETNDHERPWFAEARLVGHSDDDVVYVLGWAFATKKKMAKDLAAKAGFEWLRSQHPSIDLSDL
ncbi:hypothetical protein EST38_g3213 [Candolleomyces aberdarensis]|uniref:DRBM domain-containing protein n=1 Tax=Candolleomyces aberdarensis TaxID=2316362 RepID=A0A4Q2DR09_9AGAR|nr:hypothetical protein EST38_g3213 [Candolleomyces aberdarensis]